MKRLEKIKKVAKNFVFKDYPIIIVTLAIALIICIFALFINNSGLKIILVSVAITFIAIAVFFVVYSFKIFKIYQVASKVNTPNTFTKEIKTNYIKFYKVWSRCGYKLIGLEFIDDNNDKYYFVLLVNSMLTEKLIDSIKKRIVNPICIHCYNNSFLIESIDELPDYLFK